MGALGAQRHTQRHPVNDHIQKTTNTGSKGDNPPKQKQFDRPLLDHPAGQARFVKNTLPSSPSQLVVQEQGQAQVQCADSRDHQRNRPSRPASPKVSSGRPLRDRRRAVFRRWLFQSSGFQKRAAKHVILLQTHNLTRLVPSQACRSGRLPTELSLRSPLVLESVCRPKKPCFADW